MQQDIPSPAAARKRGRPPKFAGKRRPVTVTLPDNTLQQLTALDADRARAIVQAVALATATRGGDRELVETRAVTPDAAIIVVPPSRVLREAPWLHLVEVAPGRFLMAVDASITTEKFELYIQDQLDELPENESYERGVLRALHKVVSGSRRRKSVSRAEILLVHAARST